MTLLEAIDLVVARTGVERYRYLCLEHPEPRVRAEYTALMHRLAAEPAPETARPWTAPPSGYTPCCGGVPMPPE